MSIPRVESPYSNTFVIYTDSETFYYSYSTCIGYSNMICNLNIRVNKFFSNTTSKHVGKLRIGNFEKIDETEFHLLINRCQNKVSE